MLRIFKSKLYLTLTIATILVVLVGLDYLGIIWHNDPFAYFYQVKGLDVSSHQGDIDWQEVAKSGSYSFVYIKSTEGHDFFDDNFQNNWQEARSNGFLVGAYHFFSVRSSGQAQAEGFISYVPKESDALPPLIDIEIDTAKNPIAIRNEIETMASMLKEHYGKKPILYFTYDTYNAYIKDHFTDYNVWIRDVIKPPFLINRKWLFWQYKNRGRIDGIDTYVDINVFNGDLHQLMSLTKVQ